MQERGGFILLPATIKIFSKYMEQLLLWCWISGTVILERVETNRLSPTTAPAYYLASFKLQHSRENPGKGQQIPLNLEDSLRTQRNQGGENLQDRKQRQGAKQRGIPSRIHHCGPISKPCKHYMRMRGKIQGIRGNNVKHTEPETGLPIPNSHSVKPHNSKRPAYNNQEDLASLLWNS